MSVLLIACLFVLSAQAMTDNKKYYPIDDLLFESCSHVSEEQLPEIFLTFIPNYQYLAKQADWFVEKIEKEEFEEINNQVRTSPEIQRYSDLIEELDKLKVASPDEKRKFKEKVTPRFKRHAEHLKMRVNLLQAQLAITSGEEAA